MKNKMMKIFPVIFLILLVSSCKEYDVEIDQKYRKALNSYSTNDTIYFENQFGDLDTMRIIGTDSTEIRRIFLGTEIPMKNIYLRVQNLPNDNWQEDMIAGIDNEPKEQPIIHILKQYGGSNESSTIIKLKFRDFEGEINGLSNKIDTVKSDYTRFKPTEDKVDILYWSNKIGIIGYKKRNGQEYHIRKK
jgi:hypothetical protein